MKQDRMLFSLATLVAVVCWAISPARATAQQEHPTAVQDLGLSAFFGTSGVFTGLSGGKNLSVTGGADLAFLPFHGLRPVAEIRGTYPTDPGQIDSQRSVLGGLRVDVLPGHRWHPYGDFLFGRGEMKYGQGYYFENYEYVLTTTNVWSFGAGFDYDLTPHFSVKVDGQMQQWGTTPTPSGSIYSKVGTAAVVYRFDFNGHHRRR